MKYNKPEIVASAEAVRGIQGQVTKTVIPSDGVDPLFTAPSAYEADE